MNFFKDPRTNWRYILIILILATIVGGGILWISMKQEVPSQFSEIRRPEKIEIDWKKSPFPSEVVANSDFLEYIKEMLNKNPELDITQFTKRGTQSIYLVGEPKRIFDPTPPLEFQSSPAKESSEWVFSPDSKKAITIFSEILAGDNTLDIYINGKYETLKFCGTPCKFWFISWLNNEQFIFIQVREYYPPTGETRCSVDTKCTYVIETSLYNLVKNTETIYQSQELEKPVEPEGPDWWREIKKTAYQEIYRFLE